MPSRRVVRTMDPVPVALARLHGRKVDMPDVRVDLGDLEAAFAAVGLDEAELHAFGHLGEEGEVGSGAIEGGAEGVGLAGPDLHGATVAVREGGAFQDRRPPREDPRPRPGVFSWWAILGSNQ